MTSPDGMYNLSNHNIILHLDVKHYQYDDLVILVSDRGHYSLKKSADLCIYQRRFVPKFQTSSIKIDRTLFRAHRQPFYYPAKNKKVVEWGRPGQMVRLTPHIIMDI